MQGSHAVAGARFKVGTTIQQDFDGRPISAVYCRQM